MAFADIFFVAHLTSDSSTNDSAPIEIASDQDSDFTKHGVLRLAPALAKLLGAEAQQVEISSPDEANCQQKAKDAVEDAFQDGSHTVGATAEIKGHVWNGETWVKTSSSGDSFGYAFPVQQVVSTGHVPLSRSLRVQTTQGDPQPRILMAQFLAVVQKS